ncbi:hypothetical protein Dsin_016333 [Dipteronia sinensis]|uniref:DUF4283 domain-containing protein n=1 Tax=Dipteronia sinensis TaxID=43782 RepID=A0AAE0E5L9_9ROSI|nr:hypothetical protein Dsin_016333 [Dipteronia sinensis]
MPSLLWVLFLSIEAISSMASVEIEDLCGALTLSDEDGLVCNFSGVVNREDLQEVQHYLVGKVLSGKKVNKEAFCGVIVQLWSSIGQVEIESVDENVFVFYFRRLEDRDLVWARGPWNFDRNLIV